MYEKNGSYKESTWYMVGKPELVTLRQRKLNTVGKDEKENEVRENDSECENNKHELLS